MVQVLFCSTENGRTSFVRQLEPDWHIDMNPDIIFQLAVNFYFLFKDIKTHIVQGAQFMADADFLMRDPTRGSLQSQA
ncbi:hypothetical protein RHMOL_Rhmol04G0081300 [Rhododendron molle]|uniref:Uncharacterized protein n=1 Tax=Rhododendron molle TaxID=49168 RepID=A0ACC0NYF8_RHOML|nr:hypothetical protein RHMOL_Rhmol04G0081300 [Rhododendron molle]